MSCYSQFNISELKFIQEIIMSLKYQNRPLHETEQELQDELRAKLAREREDRLQRSIQNTLQKLGKAVDTNHQTLDIARQSERKNSKSPERPSRPNKFWAASMQKVAAEGLKNQMQQKHMDDDDAPRPTNFDLEEFLGKAPDDQDQLKISPLKAGLNDQLDRSESEDIALNEEDGSPAKIDDHKAKWKQEDENRSVEIVLALNKDQEDSMEFDDPSPEKKEDSLSVNLNNLVNSGKADQAQNKNDKTINNRNMVDDRPTLKGNAYKVLAGAKKGQRKSIKPPTEEEQYPPALFDFFKSLDFNPSANNQGTMRASYKTGNETYNIYGVPGQMPGQKGQVFLQSQEGFNKDLPPIRLSEKERDQLMKNFQELEQLQTESADEDPFNNISEGKAVTQKNLPYAGKVGQLSNSIGSPSRDKHVRAKGDGMQRDNKTFWSSGVEKGSNVPNATRKKQGSPVRTVAKQDDFQLQFDNLMNKSSLEAGTPGQFTPEGDTLEKYNLNKQDGLENDRSESSKQQGYSLKNIAYNGMSSLFGGFGGYQDVSQNDQVQENNSTQPEVQTPQSDEQQKYVPPKVNQQNHQRRNSSPSRPKHSRFTKMQNQSVASEAPNDPFQVQSPPAQFVKQPQREADPPEKSISIRSFRQENSVSTSSQRLRKSKERKPVVMKLTASDFDTTKKFKEEPEMDSQQQRPQPKQSSQEYQYKAPVVIEDNDQFKEGETPDQNKRPKSRSRSKSASRGMRPESKQMVEQEQHNQYQENIDLGLPNVIILVADNVKLIRNNAVPMLQVQLEIIQNAMSFDSDMCMLGLNDVIYIVPEFNPIEYDSVYCRISQGNEFEMFKPFFDHYLKYKYNFDNPHAENIPERMLGLNKNSMTAIERDHYEPDLRGKSFINLKNIPNGHYSIYYLRIGQPISINSRLKVLGKAKNIYININREKISHDKKPQLDLNHSSSKISRKETSKFKIIKHKQSKRRDNKILQLNSDDESESEEETPDVSKQADDDYKKLFGSQKNKSGASNVTVGLATQADSQEDPGLEMEFEENGESASQAEAKKKVQAPPLQDSKDYYNSTQRMTETMIQNPQFQIYSIDEEGSVTTSMRESMRSEMIEDSVNINAQIDQLAVNNISHVSNQRNGEDAFRNAHLESESEQPVSPSRISKSISQNDVISRQIEDYQMSSMANLADIIKKKNQDLAAGQTPQSQRKQSPRMRKVQPITEAAQPLEDAIANQSMQKERKRSNSSRGARSPRVKTISLKDLEDNPNDSRRQPTQHSRSRSQSQPRSQTAQYYPADFNAFRPPPNMEQRETTKIEVINLNNRPRSRGRVGQNAPVQQQPLPPQQMLQSQQHQQPPQQQQRPQDPMIQSILTNNMNRSKSPVPQPNQQNGGIRPWNRQQRRPSGLMNSMMGGGNPNRPQSRPRQQEMPLSPQNQQQKPLPLNLLQQQNSQPLPPQQQQRQQFQNNQQFYPQPDNSQNNTLNESRRRSNSQGHKRPGSASQGRDRFFSPKNQVNKNLVSSGSAAKKRSVSQLGRPNHGRFGSNSRGLNQSMPQVQGNDQNMAPVMPQKPQQQLHDGFSNENFSDDSPARPIGFNQMPHGPNLDTQNKGIGIKNRQMKQGGMYGMIQQNGRKPRF